MGTVIITGIFALVGAFVGAYLHRKTQHESWLLEQRAVAFANFLRTLDKCIEDGNDALQEGLQDDSNMYRKLMEIYKPAFLHSRIVSLFVMHNSKQRVSKLVREIVSLHLSRIDHEKRRGTISEKEEELQNILEENLLSPKWNKPNRKIGYLLSRLRAKLFKLL